MGEINKERLDFSGMIRSLENRIKINPDTDIDVKKADIIFDKLLNKYRRDDKFNDNAAQISELEKKKEIDKLDLSSDNIAKLMREHKNAYEKSPEPNRLYEIDGFRISTDDNGKAYKVNDNFISNNEYILNGNEYKTDDNGERFPQSPEGYERPYLRAGVKKEIYDNAPKDKEGRYLDPNTGKPIERTPDIGHKPGCEHWRESKKAYAEGISQEKFNDRMNNSDYYQLEDPSNNRSHKYEDKSEY